MANFNELKEAIKQVIKTNGNEEITGAVMQNTLLSLISSLSSNRTYAGIANVQTIPGTPDGNVFYMASQTGDYPNFGLSLKSGETAIFYNDSSGAWVKASSEFASTTANRDYLYLGGKSKSTRVINAGLVDAVLDAYIDYTPIDGKYYVLSLWNKTEAGDFFFAFYERDIETDEYQQKIYFPKSSGIKIFNDIYLHTVGNSKVLVNWGALPPAPWGMSVTQADGMELSPRIFSVGTLNDVTKVASDLANIKKYVNDWIALNQITANVLSNNLHNYVTDVKNKSLSNSGLTETETASYNLSQYIEVEPGASYICNNTMRKIWDFPDKGIAATMTENKTSFTPTGKYIRFIYSNAILPQNIKFGKSGNNINDDYISSLFWQDNEILTPYSNVISDLYKQIQYKPSDNLHNPDTDTLNKSIQSDGSLLDNPLYNTTDYIEVLPGTNYYMLGQTYMRRVVQFNANRNIVLSTDSIAQVLTEATTAFVRFMYANTDKTPSDIKFGKLGTDINQDFELFPYDKYNRRIAFYGDSPVGDEGEKFVTLENSDKILFVGSSSTESHYTLKNKSWFMKLNDVLDWLFVTYAFSGNSATQLTNRLKNNQPSPTANGLPPSQIKPSYVHVGQFGNMSDDGLNAGTSSQFIEANRKLMLVAQSVFNAQLIVGTGYHIYDQYQLETALRDLADEFGADFIPWGYYNDKVMRIVDGYRSYKGFYGSAHPGTRSNNSYYQEALNFFEKWQKPKQCIKLFKPRTGTVDYNYRDNYERSQKYYSVEVGEQSLSDTGAGRYDSLEPVDYTPFTLNQSEYYTLIKKQDVSFGNILAVEFILPVIAFDKVNIYITTTETLTVKLYNNLTNQFVEISNIEALANNIYKIPVENFAYFMNDKVKLLLSGNVTISDIYIGYVGGREKQRIDKMQLLDYAGRHLIGGTGFADDWTTIWSNTGAATAYKQAERYGAEFVDIPGYLNAANANIIELAYDVTIRKNIMKTFTQSELYGDRSTNAPLHLRVEVYARMWCKIYDPEKFALWEGENNPFTDTPILTTDSYDFGTMQVGITGANNRTAILSKPVGMFWARIPFDVYLPPFSGNQTISISRKPGDINNTFVLEISDVIISVID